MSALSSNAELYLPSIWPICASRGGGAWRSDALEAIWGQVHASLTRRHITGGLVVLPTTFRAHAFKPCSLRRTRGHSERESSSPHTEHVGQRSVAGDDGRSTPPSALS